MDQSNVFCMWWDRVGVPQACLYRGGVHVDIGVVWCACGAFTSTFFKGLGGKNIISSLRRGWVLQCPENC